MSEISLKPATKDDVQVLFDLLSRLARELGKDDEFDGSPKALEKYGFASPPAFEAIIAWRDQEPLGMILYFFEFSTWRGKPGIFVQDFYVRPDARGLGLGRKLTAAAAAAGAAKGATYMELAVHDDNDSGLGFYQANGFVPVEGETVMLLDGEAFKGMTKADQ